MTLLYSLHDKSLKQETSKLSVHEGVNYWPTLISCLHPMRFSLTDLCNLALPEEHTAHCSGVKVPNLFYAQQCEMLVVIVSATL